MFKSIGLPEIFLLLLIIAVPVAIIAISVAIATRNKRPAMVQMPQGGQAMYCKNCGKQLTGRLITAPTAARGLWLLTITARIAERQ